MLTVPPFPRRSPPFPGNAACTRSPVPLPLGGNGEGNAFGVTRGLLPVPLGGTPTEGPYRLRYLSGGPPVPAAARPDPTCSGCGERVGSCGVRRWLSGCRCCDGCDHDEGRADHPLQQQRRPPPARSRISSNQEGWIL